MTIGVFDSGIGGVTIAQTLRRDFPNARIISISDTPHMPYGTKSSVEVIRLTHAAIQPLLHLADIIVIACNTATTITLPSLRETYPDQLFIGIEPMLKPAAALTKTGIVCVCATSRTLASERYSSLKQQFCKNIEVFEPNCSSWAERIEQNSLNEQSIRQTIEPALHAGADVVVLGCTHYHWIKDEVEKICGNRAIVLEPSQAITRRVRQLVSGLQQ